MEQAVVLSTGRGEEDSVKVNGEMEEAALLDIVAGVEFPSLLIDFLAICRLEGGGSCMISFCVISTSSSSETASDFILSHSASVICRASGGTDSLWATACMSSTHLNAHSGNARVAITVSYTRYIHGTRAPATEFPSPHSFKRIISQYYMYYRQYKRAIILEKWR